MTPGVSAYGGAEEKRLERPMGCVSGFLKMFDHHHHRFSTRRLCTSPSAESTPPSARSEASSSASFLSESHPPPSSPEPCPSPESRAAAETPARQSLPLALSVFEINDGASISWRIRDSPRLSLDSSAAIDSKGKLRPREIRMAVPISSGDQSDYSEVAEEQLRSSSVVARLMGINALPSAGSTEPDHAELRRSASVSGVRRDSSPAPREAAPSSAEVLFKTLNLAQFSFSDAKKSEPPPSRSSYIPPLQRKSCLYAEDFFPETKQSGTLYGEIERRLRMRGIDEPAKDLETLKQVLEALQLQGLLHSKTSSEHHTNSRGHLIHDFQSHLHSEGPTVITKTASKPPWRSSMAPRPLRSSTPCQSALTGRRYQAMVDQGIKLAKEETDRAPRSPRSPRSPANRRPLSGAAQKSPQSQRTISTVGFPKFDPKRADADPLAVASPTSQTRKVVRYRRERVRSPAENDASPLNLERSKAESRKGRGLLDRCEHSTGEQITVADQQPSPVSVFDSAPFFSEESSPSPSPSPVAKRSIHFKDQSADDWEEQLCPAIHGGDCFDGPDEVDQDYAYVRAVLRAARRYGDTPDAVYEFLEKRCSRRLGASKAARLHRRLVFDTVAEILESTRHVCSWDAFSCSGSAGGEEALLQLVWEEVRRIRAQETARDHEAAACGAAVRKKDMAAGWRLPTAEMSDAVLQIERLIFKDLIGETIRDLSADSRRLVSRRKLVF